MTSVYEEKNPMDILLDVVTYKMWFGEDCTSMAAAPDLDIL